MLLRWLLCALCCAGAIESYRILVVFPFPGRSHGILGHGVVRHLLNAGHEVTYINHVAIQKPHPKLRQIDISEDSEKPVANLKTIMDKEENLFDLNKFFNMTVGLFRAALRNQQVQELLLDTAQTFDIVIAEWLFTDLYSGFATVFDCPFIWVSTVEPHSTILRLIDESLNPAYNAELIATVAPPYTFVERAKGLFMSVVGTLMKDFYFGRAEAKEFETLLGPIIKKRGRPVPDYADVKYNTSLVLGNSHVSVGEATRLPQNYKAVGGYHIESDIKPLPEDLKKLLDNAKHGVIYFSMGSNLKSKDFPQQLKQELLQMFGTLKQTVLWKFEEDLPNRPGNVHILKWAPQPAILSHPKCILFITHGGLLSSSETIYFGKATIGIPVFADQFLNVERAVKKGYGRRVDLSYHMAGDLKVAIEDVLANPSYANKAKELSFVFHHRPVPPGAELVHWVEHVIRTGGAPHLRSPALHVPLYQKMYLDLAAVVLIAGVVLCKLVKCVCCGKGTKTKLKKN